MSKRIFCYDFRGHWKDMTVDASLLAEEMPPLVFCVAYHNEGTGETWEKVWCEEHHAYEEVKYQAGCCIVTEQGCHLTGLCTKVHIYIQLSGWNASQRHHGEANLCWRVQTGTEPGTLHCICEKIRLSFTWQKNEESDIAYLCPHPLARFRHEWTISASTLNSKNHIPQEILQVIRKELQLSSTETNAKDQLPISEEWNMERFLALNEQSFHRKDFTYHEEELAYECSICGYNFRLISSIEQFCHIVRSIEGTRIQQNELRQKATALLTVERNGNYLAGIVLNGKQEHRIYRKYDQNTLSEVKLHAVCDFWKIKNGIGDVDARYRYWELAGQLQVEMITDKTMEPFSLRQLLQIPSEKLRKGYYLLLHRRMAEAGLPLVKAPGNDMDEKSYLMEEIPIGDKIFTAAFQGNAEAEYALHLLYSDFSCFSRPCRHMANRWYRKAVEHGWTPEKMDVRLDEVSS